MPRLTSLAVRLAMLHLIAGFSIGALMLISKATGGFAQSWAYLPVHIDLLLVGWMAQLAAAVAYWILPRFRGGQRPLSSLAWFTILALNTGVLLVAGHAAFPAAVDLSTWGKGLQTAGVLTFAVHAWQRIKAPGAS